MIDRKPKINKEKLGKKKTGKKIVVFGASGHAKVVLDIILRQGIYEVAGLLDNYKPVGTPCGVHQVLGDISALPGLAFEHAGLGCVVAIGDNWSRARIVNKIRECCPDLNFATAVHPSAQVAEDAFIGQGTVIMAGAVVNSGAYVGPFCILNTHSSLDHDSVMEEFSSLGPAAVTGGSIYVGGYSNVGIGATVVQEVTIGRHTVIGAGAVVMKSVPDEVVVYGTPARIIRSRKIGERYLSESSGHLKEQQIGMAAGGES